MDNFYKNKIVPEFEKVDFKKEELYFKNKLLKFGDIVIELRPCPSDDSTYGQDWEYLNDDRISGAKYDENNDLIEIEMESKRVYILFYASYPGKMCIKRAE